MENNNTIYETIVGSVAYGLNTSESDIDRKGIFIPNKENYFGLYPCEQLELSPDHTLYSIKKFFNLARDCNPNIVEMLYVDEKHILNINKYGKRIRENRDLFLSTKAKHTFSGYAFAQLKRIKGHRKWIMFDQEPPKEEEYFIEKYRSVNGFSVPYTKFLEHEYDLAKKKYAQYLKWKKERNPKRAELEDKYGYDCKHGMHLMRLLRMGEEILLHGEVNVYRKDREDLLEIRNGVWTYDLLIAEAEKIEKSLEELYTKSTLPKKPNDKKINELLISITEEFLKDKENNK